MDQTIFIRLPTPLSTLHLRLPPTTSLSSLPLPISSRHGYLRHTSSGPLSPSLTLADLANDDGHPIHLEYAVRLLGGKGGFGSQLRAAGGRMSSGKATNNDSCRDLSGRRLATVKEAQKLADYVESSAQREKEASLANKAKLEALERSLGIGSSKTMETEAESSSAPGIKRKTSPDLVEIAQKKHRFDDTAYLEQSREINDNVRSAVTAGLLKKRKAKAAASKAAAATGVAPTKDKGKAATQTQVTATA